MDLNCELVEIVLMQTLSYSFARYLFGAWYIESVLSIGGTASPFDTSDIHFGPFHLRLVSSRGWRKLVNLVYKATDDFGPQESAVM
jgi:hypothetical protein